MPHINKTGDKLEGHDSCCIGDGLGAVTAPTNLPTQSILRIRCAQRLIAHADEIEEI